MGKPVGILAALMTLCAVGLGYWFRSATRVQAPAQASPAPAAGAPATSATRVVGTIMTSAAPATPVDFGPDMGEIAALQNTARAALQAEHWDEAASMAQRGLALVEKRAGTHEPLRILFLGFQVEAAAGAKRFPEAANFIQALLDQMNQSPPEWQEYMVTVHRGRAAIDDGQGNYADAAQEWGQSLVLCRRYPKLANKDIEMFYLISQVNAFNRAKMPDQAKAVIDTELALAEHNHTQSEHVEFELSLARHIRDGDLQTAKRLAEDALAIGQRLPDARLNPDAVEAEAAVADIDFRISGKPEPEGTSESNPEVAKTMDQFEQQAQEFSNTGKPRQALDLMAKRMSLAAQTDGKDSVVYALALNDFADAASSAGVVDVGEKAHRDAIAIIEAKEGPDGFDLATPLNNLATLLYFGSKNRTSEVEMLWQRSLAISEKYEGPLHLESLVTRANVGYAHKLLKHWDQAERSFKEAIAIAAWHGDVSEASSAWFGMFELRRDQGRLDEAEPFVLRSYDLRVQSLGLRHPKTRMTMNNVVWLKRQLGRPQEAVPFLEQLANAESEIYGPNDMNTFLRRWELAGLYGEVGDWEKADTLGKELEGQTAVVYSHPLGDGFDPRVPR
jgi:tetratricopeptide (TPR) repeat protein